MHVDQVEAGAEHQLLHAGGDVHRQAEIRHAAVEPHGKAEADRDDRDVILGAQRAFARGRKEQAIGGRPGAIVRKEGDYLAPRALEQRARPGALHGLVGGGHHHGQMPPGFEGPGKIRHMLVDGARLAPRERSDQSYVQTISHASPRPRCPVRLKTQRPGPDGGPVLESHIGRRVCARRADAS